MGRRMTKIDLKYVKAYRRNGDWYYYFRRKNCPTIRLPGAAGSRQFNEAYEAALTDKPRPQRHSSGTFGKLVEDYYRSVDFQNLKPNSRAAYRTVLDPLVIKHGHRLVKDMGRDNARKILEAIGKPGMANLTRAVLKRVMGYAIVTGWRNDNPLQGIKPYKIGTRHTWTEEQLGAYEERWPVGSQERLDFASFLYSGQRGSDVVRMRRPAPKAATMKVIQQKTGVELVIPIHPEWRRIINKTPSNSLYLIHDAKGQPIQRPMLTLRIMKAAKAAGLPVECKAHGLRKALMRRLAEAGKTSKQIAAVSGHKTLKEIERYTEAASQARLAAEAMSDV